VGSLLSSGKNLGSPFVLLPGDCDLSVLVCFFCVPASCVMKLEYVWRFGRECADCSVCGGLTASSVLIELNWLSR